jgi:hypothetical protein
MVDSGNLVCNKTLLGEVVPLPLTLCNTLMDCLQIHIARSLTCVPQDPCVAWVRCVSTLGRSAGFKETVVFVDGRADDSAFFRSDVVIVASRGASSKDNDGDQGRDRLHHEGVRFEP